MTFTLHFNSFTRKQLTKSQRRELADLIKAGPQAVDYTSGCWNTPMIQDLIYTRFGVCITHTISRP